MIKIANHYSFTSQTYQILKKQIFDLKRRVHLFEKYFDQKRDLNLFKLKRKTFYPANKAKMINNTGVEIPPEVVSLLEFDPVNHEIVTFDIKAMYPNINLNSKISHSQKTVI